MTIPVWEIAIVPAPQSAAVPVITITPPNPMVPDTTPKGAQVATYTVTMSDGSNFGGTFGFGPPNFDSGGMFALSGTNVTGSIIVNPTGPGVPSVTTPLTELITLLATQA